MTPRTRFRPLIRLFVSSTFSDFVHERDALQRTVWPKLEQHCERRGFQFQAIDLRWGVSAEAGLDHRTMQICFDELRRAQEVSPEPNFLMLLGDRYGWRPLPERISVRQYARLEAAARAMDDSGASLGKLQEWYPLDANSVPPVHALKSRIGTFTERDAAAWSEIEAALWRIINLVYPREQFTADRFHLPVMPPEDRFGQPPFPEIVRFQSSATEQEIWGGALTIDEPCRHLLACFRQIENRPDFESGRLSPAAVRDYLHVSGDRVDPDLTRFQDELKQAVRARLTTGRAAGDDSCFDLRAARLGPRDDGSAPWSIVLDDACRASLQAMCDWIERRLTTIIDGQIDEFHGAAEPAPAGVKSQRPDPRRRLELEQAEHERFGRERSETFVGRAAELQQIVRYCRNSSFPDEESGGPLLVHGASGCGKSAVIARAAALLGNHSSSEGSAPVVRFLGISPRSSRLRDLLSDICRELQPQTGEENEEARTVSEWIDECRIRLMAVAARRPVVLMLDALDQLADVDDLHELRWIPRGDWPTQLRIVISCLSDREPTEPAGRAWQTLLRLFPRATTVALDPLSEQEAAQFLFAEALPRSGRTLTETQRRRIEPRLADPEARQALALTLLAEELRTWRSGDAPPLPGVDTPALLRHLVDRLCRPENHGATMVRTALGSLAAARRGLSETEMLEVLFEDPEYRAEFLETSRRNRHSPPTETGRIPIALWARLRADLAPYLVERSAAGGIVMTFHHRLMSEFLTSRFVQTSNSSVRNRLIEHFERRSFFRESMDEQRRRSEALPPTPRPVHLRKVDELPWLLRAAGRHERLESLFLSLEFLEASVEGGRLFELMGEFRATIDALPTGQRARVERLAEAIEQDLSFLVRFPTTLFQCLWSRCWWYDAPQAEAHFSEGEGQWPVTGPPWKQRGPKLCELLEHWRSGKEALTPGFRWLRSLRPPETMLGAGQIRVFSGHQAAVTAIVPLRQTDRIISASNDGTIRLWSRETGRELRCIDAADSPITDLVTSPDERFAVAASSDGTVRAWEIETGELDRTLFRSEQTNDFLKRMTCLAAAPDGRLFAVGGNDERIRLWSWDEWSPMPDIKAIAPLARLAVSPDSTTLFSGTSLGLVSFTLSSPVLVDRQRSTRGSTDLLAISPNGMRLAVGTTGTPNAVNAAFILSSRNGRVLQALTEHPAPVTTLCFSPDSQRLITGCRDRQLRVWEIESGKLLSSQSLPAVPCSLVLMNDGCGILCGLENGEVRELPLREGTFLPRPDGHRDMIHGIAFSRCGRQIATAGEQIRLWDGLTGAPRAMLLGSLDTIVSVHFAPDGRLLAAREQGGGCWLWDSWLGTPLSRFVLPCNVRLQGFSDDGQWLDAIAAPPVPGSEADEGIRGGEWPVGIFRINPFSGAPVLVHSEYEGTSRNVRTSPAHNAEPALFPSRGVVTLKSSESEPPIGWFPVHSPEHRTEIVTPANGSVWAFGDGCSLALIEREPNGVELRCHVTERLGPVMDMADVTYAAAEAWGDRLSPAHFLVAQRGAGTIEQVIRQLDSDDPDLQRAAAESLFNADLSPQQHKQVCSRLSLALLGDSSNPQPFDHVFLQMLLVRLGDVVVPGLLRQLEDANAAVRRRTLTVLRMMGPAAHQALPAVIALFSEGRLSPEEAMPVLSHVGIDARLPIGSLEQVLRFPYEVETHRRQQSLYQTAWTEAWTALRQLAQDDPSTLLPVLPTILRGLTWGFAEHRVAAARVLGEMGPLAESATPALLERLADQQSELRGMAAVALSHIHPERAADFNAVAYLSLPGQQYRNQGAYHFSQEGRDATVALPLLAGLVIEDPDYSVRYHSALALGNVDSAASEAAVAALARALEDVNPHVRDAALKAYSRLRPSPVPSVTTDASVASGLAEATDGNSRDWVVLQETQSTMQDSAAATEPDQDAHAAFAEPDVMDAADVTAVPQDRPEASRRSDGALDDGSASRAAGRVALGVGAASIFVGGVLLSFGRLWTILPGALVMMFGGLFSLGGALLHFDWMRLVRCPNCGGAAMTVQDRMQCSRCGPLDKDGRPMPKSFPGAKT